MAYAPPPGWGAPYGPTAGPAPIRLRDHPRATTALILAFVSLLICQVLSPVAWVLGHGIVKEIDANDRWSWNNRGSAAVARVLGMPAAAPSFRWTDLAVAAAVLIAGLGTLLPALGNVKRSRWLERSTRSRRSCCSTSHSPPWVPRRAR